MVWQRSSMSDESPPRRPLHERSDSHSNALAAIRLVPSTPPQLLGQRDQIYSRTPLPTHPSHFLGPGKGKGPALDDQFQRTNKVQASTESSGSSVSTTHATLQPPQIGNSATGSPISKPKPLPKKRLHIHKDNKTFSLLQDDSQPAEDGTTSPALLPAKQKSSDSLPPDACITESRSNSTGSCVVEEAPNSSSIVIPATPASKSKQPISADPINSSPGNYQFVGGLRKVPKTPDLKQRAAASNDSPLPPLPEQPDDAADVSHDLSTKPSFQSTETATTTSENTNYKVYAATSPSTSEAALVPPSSSDSNYQLIGDPSQASSVIYRPQTAISEDENYELDGDPSPETSYVNLSGPSKYSQESLIVPPLQPRTWRSNEHLGYYKSRSRESLRTGSLTSISTVLSQQEASRAIVGSGSLIQLPVLKQKQKGTSSWAEPLGLYPPRSHMNEHPHQWSSQLSTVLSVSDGGTDRGSRSWSDDNGRGSGGFPSTPSRHSRQMLSISSSLAAQEEDGSRSRSDSIEPPTPAFARNGHRHLSNSSIRMVGDQDEHGDGITDMQDLRARPSRTRLSGFFNTTSSDGRTNTMRSTTSSRSNSLLASSIPTWARLYYGSGERRYLGAPGSSTEGTDSRASSFRSGSPNTDHFPLSIYSPRRRPRDINPGVREPSTQGSPEITPAPQLGSDGQLIHDPYSRRFRTWSMSSIWSPHLRLDRRATRRSVWEPPSVNWSTEGGWFGRRNVQIVMFIAGFIFPFGMNSAASHFLFTC